jgi:hypothetical protein
MPRAVRHPPGPAAALSTARDNAAAKTGGRRLLATDRTAIAHLAATLSRAWLQFLGDGHDEVAAALLGCAGHVWRLERCGDRLLARDERHAAPSLGSDRPAEVLAGIARSAKSTDAATASDVAQWVFPVAGMSARS